MEKAALEAKVEKKKRSKKNRQTKKNNNNQIRYNIMKGVTISPGLSATMTTYFKNFTKSAAAYTAAKDYKHWLGVIKILEPIPEKE